MCIFDSKILLLCLYFSLKTLLKFSKFSIMKNKHEISSDRIDFGIGLKALREAAGYKTRYGFSQVTTLTQAKIGQIENGSGYTIDSLVAYLDGLGMRLADLLSGKAKGAGNADAEEEKRPVGRPKKVVEPIRIPALKWGYYEHLQHPEFNTVQKCNWAGIGDRAFWCAQEPSPLWFVNHVVCEAVNGAVEWMIVNRGHTDPYIRGIAGNRQAAMDAIEAKRREIGDYTGWDFSSEDAEG